MRKLHNKTNITVYEYADNNLKSSPDKDEEATWCHTSKLNIFTELIKIILLNESNSLIECCIETTIFFLCI